MILSKWNQEHAQVTLAAITREAESKEKTPTKPNIQAFLATVEVRRIEVIENDILTPLFNIYAEGALIQDEDIWTKIRKTLAQLTYDSTKSGNAEVNLAPYDCNICHGVDHPRGLCKYPSLPGWKGPSGLDDRRTNFGMENRRDRPAPFRSFQR
jgi:hypothetical protein